MRRFVSGIVAALGVAGAVAPGVARGGGYEMPDNGTEALGRGGAFVAKADDGTALYYNVAGLAQQRGTRVTLDANLILHDIAFTRAGVYPGDPTDARTPWGGQPYPTIHNGDQLFLAPFLGLSTDFGWFKRWTFGFGIYGPPSAGRRKYGVTGDSEVATVKLKLADGRTIDAPAPSRYDITRTDLLIIFPTLSVAYRIIDAIDVGAAVQLVYGHFSLANANLLCSMPPEHPDCDAYGAVNTSGVTGTFMLSGLFHPLPWFDIGVNFRPQVSVHTEGTLLSVSPPGQPKFPEAKATFDSTLPAYLRLGLRAAAHYPDGTERADVEIDGVWEHWSAERASHLHGASDDIYVWKQAPPPAAGEPLPPQYQIDVDVAHNYKDTFGVRIGGAYNFRPTDTTRIIARLGGFFDSAATDLRDTRLDFNTAAKWGLTVGAGFKIRGFTLNLAYAYLYSPVRDVTDSQLTAVSAINGTVYSQSDPKLMSGNGRYEATTHIVSLGLTCNFNEFKTATLSPH